MNNNLLTLYFGTQNMPVKQNNDSKNKPEQVNHKICPKLEQDISGLKDTFESFKGKVCKVKTEIDKRDIFVSKNSFNS